MLKLANLRLNAQQFLHVMPHFMRNHVALSAQGYVIAHEVGHHVQKLLGIEPKVRQLQQNASQAEVNRLSVRMELQAFCT